MQWRKTAVFSTLVVALFVVSLVYGLSNNHSARPTPSAATRTPAPSALPTTAVTPAGRLEQACVVSVIDGDTIEVEINGRRERVRYIGMDAPETDQNEATVRNREFVGGKCVRLERDVSNTDRFGRLLRYVWVAGTMVNAELVRLGLAQANTYRPDVRHQNLLDRLEREARQAGRGMWAGDARARRDGDKRRGPGMQYDATGSVRAGQRLLITARTADRDWYLLEDGTWISAQLVEDPPEVPVAGQDFGPDFSGTPVSSGGSAVSGLTPHVADSGLNISAPAPSRDGCDTSYPDVCIPPPPPDLDCGDIDFRRFTVDGADPHRFDGDHDGVGCEGS